MGSSASEVPVQQVLRGVEAVVAFGSRFELPVSGACQAAILAFTSYDDGVLSPAARLIMDGFRLGWRSEGFYPGAFGDYLGRGGSINWGTDAAGNRGNVHCGIMKFNLQVEAAFVANSRLTGVTGSPANILRDAYDAAWS